MFKDTRRRFKQQILQGVGAAEATDDTGFKDQLEEYKNTCFAIKSLRKSMAKHLECVRQMHESSAALTVELAAFHQATDAAQSTVSLGQAMAETERVQLGSVERLYEEEIKAATELLLWRVPEVEEQVKDRKKMLLDYDAHLRKYESLSRTGLDELDEEESSQGGGSNNSKAGSLFHKVLKKKRSEQEAALELASRKIKVEKSEHAVDQSTTWLMEQFDDLAEKREMGKVLEGPMSALVACHLHLMKNSLERLERLAQAGDFGSVEIFLKTLQRYDQEPLVKQQETIDAAGVAHMANISFFNNKKKKAKGAAAAAAAPSETTNAAKERTLDSGTPAIVCDCVAWIRANGLDTEGLFRIPGRQDTVDDMIARYDLGEKRVITSVDNIMVHDVCTLLKQWLRELTQPLIPAAHYKPLMDLVRQDLLLEKSSTITSVLQMASSMPQDNQHVLGLIAVLLNEVVKNEKVNQMSVANVAICLAPSLLRAPADLEAAEVIADIQAAISACKIFILHAHKLDQPKLKRVLANTTVDLPHHPTTSAV